MLHGKHNWPPEWHVDESRWFGKFFLLFSDPAGGSAFHGANLPKSAREILGWEFGGIDLGINLFLFGFINFQERKISLIEPAKNAADLLNFFLLSRRQNIEMLFQIPEKLQRIFRERNSKRKRVLLILLPWMRINLESCCKFDLKSFVVMQAWKKTK